MANNYGITTDGLTGQPAAATVLPAMKWAIAAGTANALTAAYTPVNTALTDGLILGVRAIAATTSATVTFNPDNLGSIPVKKKGNQNLAVGDIAAAGHELMLRYNLAGNRFELLNPAT